MRIIVINRYADIDLQGFPPIHTQCPNLDVVAGLRTVDLLRLSNIQLDTRNRDYILLIRRYKGKHT